MEMASRAGLVYCAKSGIVSVVFVKPLPAPPCEASRVIMAEAGVWALARLVRAVAMSRFLSFMSKDVSGIFGYDERER